MADASLALARDLKNRSREQLIDLLDERHVTASSIKDFFDLSDALLEPSNISDALTRVPRLSVAALAEGEVSSDDALLLDLCLAIADAERVTVPDVVAIAARHMCRENSITLADRPPLSEQSAGTPTGDTLLVERAALERGIILARTLDDVAREVSRTPVRLTSSGQPTTTDALRLQNLVRSSNLAVTQILSMLESAHLIHRSEGLLVATDTLDDWLSAGVVNQWIALAWAWHENLDSRVASLLRTSEWGHDLTTHADWTFPAGASWIHPLISEAVRAARLLGLADGDNALPLGFAAVNGNHSLLALTAATLLPESRDSIYVQNDLSVIAPGLLSAESDSFLRDLCDVEHAGLASTYRLSAERILLALTHGLVASDMIAQLERLSATPLPQPVRYLINEAQERFGRVRVRPWGGGSLVTCRDREVLDVMMADVSLSSLYWERVSSTTATTRLDPVTTRDVLVHGKQTATLEDSDGNVVVPLRANVTAVGRQAPVPASQALVDRLLASSSPDTARLDELDDHSAWRERQVSLAIRAKSPLDLTFDMPDGTHRSMRVIPLSLTNGRLRARDAHTDVERTLPMENVVTLSAPVA